MAVTFNGYCRERFGCKVYKLSLDGGFTCPNRDGTLDSRGCIFCSSWGGGEFAEGTCGSLEAQLEKAKARVAAKYKGGKYLAYFQSFTGTYGPLPRLEALYREALAPADIVGMSIGTRPDCLSSEIVSLLGELNREKPVFVELGLQTIHPDTARYIRRGYETAVYYDAVKRLRAAGIHTVTHIILGLPGETPDMAAETTRAAIAAGTEGVKFHLLHVLRGTDLEKDYLAGSFQCLTLPEYGQWLDLCLAELKADTVIHRITGDGAKRDLVAPQWSADKKRVLNYLNQNLKHLPVKHQ